MGCSHAVTCPLFPFLRSSLQGWRDYYCDSEDRWRECARYKVSHTGGRVPISLLPNGHHARYLKYEAESERSGVTNPTQAPGQAPPAPAGHHQPSPSQIPQRPDPHTLRTRQARSSEGGWRARLVDWMKGPK